MKVKPKHMEANQQTLDGDVSDSDSMITHAGECFIYNPKQNKELNEQQIDSNFPNNPPELKTKIRAKPLKTNRQSMKSGIIAETNVTENTFEKRLMNNKSGPSVLDSLKPYFDENLISRRREVIKSSVKQENESSMPLKEVGRSCVELKIKNKTETVNNITPKLKTKIDSTALQHNRQSIESVVKTETNNISDLVKNKSNDTLNNKEQINERMNCPQTNPFYSANQGKNKGRQKSFESKPTERVESKSLNSNGKPSEKLIKSEARPTVVDNLKEDYCNDSKKRNRESKDQLSKAKSHDLRSGAELGPMIIGPENANKTTTAQSLTSKLTTNIKSSSLPQIEQDSKKEELLINKPKDKII